MTVRDLVRALGGAKSVAMARGVTVQAVSQWCAADAVPPSHHLGLWADALRAGIAWQPPGGAAVAEILARPPVPAPCG